MKILYIGNWSLEEGLTQATVLPHLKILLENENLECLVVVTIERNGVAPAKPLSLNDSRVKYEPLLSNTFSFKFLNQIVDLFDFPKQVERLLDKYTIDKVIARASPAGGIIYKSCIQRGIPFFVESFEPHTDYMLESGVWSKWNPKFLIQKKWESDLKKFATGLITVSHNYKKALVSEGVRDSKIFVCPCAVDLDKFRFNQAEKEKIRGQLNIPPNAEVGIYVGKFGGNYFDDDAFILYKKLMEVQDFWLIIVTPDNRKATIEKAKKYEIPTERIKIMSAKHGEISSYLSAADFAFATVKPSPSKKFLSLIKIGEYWACGLPVLITKNIGDDSEFIQKENIGVVLSSDWKKQPPDYFSNLMTLLQSARDVSRIRKIAEQRRSLQNSINAYQYFELL